MITDMKAFSAMTEEDGSILSAKTIQKHRDLLLPVIEQHGGHGKSTGGDGLVAAFDDAPSALAATVDMLRVLEAHNASHQSERDLAIRVGVAEGEVVLDKGGRPFIGTALNLAARVMNLADGGQAYATADVTAKAPSSIHVYSHGPFQLKNIARPIEVVEVLWAENQVPRGPSSA
jgi:class 3 adenylate cyclase